MTEGKTQVLDRHRWILPGALLASAGAAWLLDLWYYPRIVAHRAPIWENLLFQAAVVVVLLLVTYLALRSPPRSVVGAIAFGLGLFLVYLNFTSIPAWWEMHSTWLQREILFPILRILERFPIVAHTGRLMLWIGVLSFLDFDRLVTGRKGRKGRTREWILSVVLLAGFAAAYAFCSHVVPRLYRVLGDGSLHGNWFFTYHGELGSLIHMTLTTAIWVGAIVVFVRNRWTAIPWIAVGGACSAVIVADSLSRNLSSPLMWMLWRYGERWTLRNVAYILLIGLLGFVISLLAHRRDVPSSGTAGVDVREESP